MKPFFHLDPLTRKRLQRFAQIKRGYYSLIFLCILGFFSLFAEFWINNKALFVSYEGNWYFPAFARTIDLHWGFIPRLSERIHPGTTFGEDYHFETQYLDLQKKWREAGSSNWLIMPLIPYNPYENISIPGSFPPHTPSLEHRIYLGTDSIGRDVLARLIYGFRVSMTFALIFVSIILIVGILVGISMGYFGGLFDLGMYRIIEVWVTLPGLFVIIIISDIFRMTATTMAMLLAFLSWPAITNLMRTYTFRERAREYVAAAQVVGMSNTRIILRHILPNTLAIIITFLPFAVSSGIFALAGVDYLGYGLTPPTPSWGELMKQGHEYMQAAPWILTSSITMLVIVLVAVNFIGESIREAFDPKKFTRYE